ncbi:hypothetical protein [Emcibacter sp.]|uniref:EF-hand domain-containing protein n=1 Tax=Emcibacter sp. TaxID=1979954 RepID=UPI002AA7B9A2|nr:hypothetical protein [Emcibacter sp.]
MMTEYREKNGVGRLPGVICLIVAAAILVSCAPRRGPGRGPGPGPQNPEGRLEEMKERLDVNGDGRITCDDVALKQDRMFAENDRDGNNVLDLEEFRQAPWSHPAYARDHLAIYDKDQDGVVSRQEFAARKDDHFARLDLNGDCTVTDEEIEDAMKALRGRGRPGGGIPPGSGGGRPPGGM